MADYYNIIKKTLNNLGDTTPQLREKIFVSARNTIHKQLENTPNISPEVMDKHKLNLEEAIQKLNLEYQSAQALQEPQAAQMAQPTQAAQAPQAPQAPQAAQPPIAQDQIAQAQTVQSQTAGTNLPLSDDLLAPAPAPTPAPEAPEAPETNEGAILSIPDIPESDAKFAAKRKGNLSRSIFMGLGALIIAGAGYFAWENQDKLKEMFETKVQTTASEDAQVNQTSTEALTEEKPEKNAQRLNSDGEEITADPIKNNDTAETNQEAANTSDVVIDPKPAVEENSAENSNSESPAETTPSKPTDTAATDSAAPQISTNVLFYEENTSSDIGERISGEITWSMAQESIAEGLPEEPVIKATVKIPEKKLVLLLNIKRNLDEALAASHIVELIFSVPDDFSGRQIDDARSLVFKPTEEARGVALVGVPVKVSEGIFLIALSNVENAMKQNLQVLRRLDWIDIPIKYETGRRALLSFQKNAQGKEVFVKALDAWAKL